MRRFQSGTLGRSVRRFGRFRAPTFKRKQFGWQFVSLVDQAVNLSTGATLDIVLFDKDDWLAATIGAQAVRNVSLELKVGLNVQCNVTTLEYERWFFRSAIVVLDADETGLAFDTVIGDTRPLTWHAFAGITGEQPTALGATPMTSSWNWTYRAKQRFLKLDEELRLISCFDSAVNTSIAAAGFNVFGRISYEVP